MRTWISLLLFVLLIIFPLVGNAANWCATPTGNNSDPTCASDCTAEIAAGSCMDWSDADNTTVMSPGDTLKYSGAFTIDLDAGADTPLSLGEDGTLGNIITHDFTDATFTISNTSTSGSSFFSLNGRDYIYLLNLTLTTGSGNHVDIRVISGISNCESLVIDGFDVDGELYHGLYAIDGWTNFEIKNSYFNSTRSYTSSAGNGISIRDANTGSIHNTHFGNWGHSAIEFPAQATEVVQNIDIYYCQFKRPVDAVYGHYALGTNEAGGTVRDIWFHHNKVEGIRSQLEIADSEDVFIYANIFTGFQNCCENAGDTGCTYGEVGDTNCSVGSYAYNKIGFAIWVLAPHGNLFIFNNTFNDIAEACVLFKTNPGATGDVYVLNNIFDDCSNASDAASSPNGSVPEFFDYAFVYADSNPPTVSEMENNIFNTIGATANNDTYWGGTSRTITAFDAAYAWADNNADGAPGLSVGLWPDSPSDAVVATGKVISGAPWNTVPLWDQVIDPNRTDWDADPIVVYTRTQPTLPYKGAQALSAVAQVM